jgi:hypothetical protein
MHTFSQVIDRLGGLTIGLDGAPMVQPEWWNAIIEYDREQIQASVLRYLAGIGWEPPVVFPRSWDDVARWNSVEREWIPMADVQKGE